MSSLTSTPLGLTLPDDAMLAAQRCYQWLVTGAGDALLGLEAVGALQCVQDGARRFLGCVGLPVDGPTARWAPATVADCHVAAAAARPSFCMDAVRVVRLARLPAGWDLADALAPPGDLAGPALEGLRWGACVASGVGRLVCAALRAWAGAPSGALPSDVDVAALVELLRLSPRLPLVLPRYRVSVALDAGRDPLEWYPYLPERRLWHPARVVQVLDDAVSAGRVTAAAAQAVACAVLWPFAGHPEAQGQEMPYWLCDFVDTLGDAAEDGHLLAPATMAGIVGAFRQAEASTPLKVLLLGASAFDTALAGHGPFTMTALVQAALDRTVAFPVADVASLQLSAAGDGGVDDDDAAGTPMPVFQ
jgi:hypothetical protein